MGMLTNICEFKDKLMSLILSDQRVIDLIDDPVYNEAPATGLRYRKVIPYAFIPQTIDEASTLVCFEATVSEVNTDTVCDVNLYIWVITHISVAQTDYGVRADVLADRIDDLVNHMRGFGIGKVTPATRDPVTYSLPNYDYICRQLTYLIKDFNFRYGARDR